MPIVFPTSIKTLEKYLFSQSVLAGIAKISVSAKATFGRLLLVTYINKSFYEQWSCNGALRVSYFFNFLW
jgi:hypothetical protein